jgi:hypothetical protein
MRLLTVSVFVCVLIFGAPVRQAEAQLPPAYMDLYAELSQSLTTLEDAIDREPQEMGPRPIFSAELLAAHSERGTLPAFEFGFAQRVVDDLSGLGAGAVTLTISYPALLPDFESPADIDDRLDTYRRLVLYARQRGLAVIIKTQAMLPDTNALRDFYDRLTFDEYKRGRLYVAGVIARELRPDYLSVMVEPDLEAAATGQPLNTPDGAAELAAYIARGLTISAPAGIAVGAGIGTWMPRYREYADRLVSIDALNYLDMHIYPLQRDFGVRALEIANVAAAASKGVAISEAWLYKVREDELNRSPMFAAEIVSRDTFDFWQMLDQRFLAAIVRLAKVKRLAFVSPSMTNYLFAYLDYAWVSDMSPEDRIVWETAAATRSVLRNTLSRTGWFYGWLLR